MLDHTSIAWEDTLLHHQHGTRAARRIFILTHLIRQYETVCMDGNDTTNSCSQEWKSQAFGSPHSSKIIRSYTQGDLLCPVPCFQDTRRARPPGLKTIISSDVMFLFTRLGWARTGMGDCRQKIMFIWFDCNKISRRKHNIHCSLQHQREDAQFVKIIFNFHNMKFSCMMPNFLSKLLISFKYLRD